MLTVGMECLDFLLSLLMHSCFQVFAFTKTVHALLAAFKAVLTYSMDKCLQCILWVCHSDILDQSCEWKLTLKSKPHYESFFSLSICAVIGSIINKQINIETILMFIYGVISESVRDLMPEIVQPKLKQSKCYSIPNDSVILARGIASKMATVTNIRANAHMLIEFGLELLQLTLKCGKPFVDPILPLLNHSIGSSNTASLKCFSIIISKQMSLERLDAAISIFGNIFFLPMQSVFKAIVNILWINHKKNC